jgi:hypothetical protein
MTLFRVTNFVDQAYPKPSQRLDRVPSNQSEERERSNAPSATKPPTGIRAQAVECNGRASPKLASTRTASTSAAVIKPVDTPKPKQVDQDNDPILTESAPFCDVASQVRKDNKEKFEAKRRELRKNWPEFDKIYDDYRRWRDSPQDKRIDLENAGRAAQKQIMERADLTAEQKALFSLLSNPESPLLRFISPINGDFRAPQEGVIAGLRDADENGTAVPTLAFPGTGSGSMIRAQLRTNYQQFSGEGGVPAAYDLGAMLAKECRDALINQRQGAGPLAFTGHSLGGGIASYAAATIAEPTNGYVPRCYLFNPAALGGKTLAALEKLSDLEERVKNQKIIRIKNDHVSSPAMQERIAAFLTLRTLRRIVVPRHLGEVFVVRRELLEPSNRNVFTLHRLESLQSICSRDSGIVRPAQDV